MTQEKRDQLFRLLVEADNESRRLTELEASKFPCPQRYNQQTKSYQEGWNDAIDFVLGKSKE